MQKVSHRRQFMLTLPGLVLLAAFLISGGAEALTGNIPTALAANSHDQSEAQPQQVTEAATELDACPATGEHRKPSFGSAVVVTSGEVICGDLTSFGGSVMISGEVNGNVVTFGGDVLVAGKINGNVTLYGGNLSLQDSRLWRSMGRRCRFTASWQCVCMYKKHWRTIFE